MNYPDGLRIATTIDIESPQHLAEVLAEASAKDAPVVPVGGGVALGTGNTVETEFTALSMTKLSGIDDYVPTDMTASFQAGTSLAEVKSTLAANGQELPVEIDDDDQGTIGGLVACGYAGASRLGKGTLKDVLIGCEYVTGSGVLAKAGGMTVKNVSGFEISRLLHGSWGSLAVLTRVNMKLLPIARASRTFAWHDVDVLSALQRQRQAVQSMPAAVSIETVSAEGGYVTLVRFEGRESAMDAYEQDALAQFGAMADSPVRVRPTGTQLVIHGTVQDLVDIGQRVSGYGPIAASLATGSVRVQLDPEAISIDRAVQDLPDTWMMEGGPADWKRDHSVWGPARADAGVARSVKYQFDPAQILNRGRLFV